MPLPEGWEIFSTIYSVTLMSNRGQVVHGDSRDSMEAAMAMAEEFARIAKVLPPSIPRRIISPSKMSVEDLF
jgi:hypothetical protein